MFAERVPLPTAMTSADAGVSFHYNLPSNYGDVHVGVYNGENYQRVEVNDQKALRIPRHASGRSRRGLPVLRGPPRASRLLRRPLRRRRRAQARDGQRDLRAPVRERRVRLPRAPRTRRWRPPPTSTSQRLLDLGDAADAARQRRVVGRAAPVRPLDAEHARPRSRRASTVTGARASRVQRPAAESNDRRRGVLVSAPGQRQHGDPARLRRADASTTSPRRRPRRIAVHGLLNF